MVLRVRPTRTELPACIPYTPIDQTPFHLKSNVRWPWRVLITLTYQQGELLKLSSNYTLLSHSMDMRIWENNLDIHLYCEDAMDSNPEWGVLMRSQGCLTSLIRPSKYLHTILCRKIHKIRLLHLYFKWNLRGWVTGSCVDYVATQGSEEGGGWWEMTNKMTPTGSSERA